MCRSPCLHRRCASYRTCRHPIVVPCSRITSLARSLVRYTCGFERRCRASTREAVRLLGGRAPCSSTDTSTTLPPLVAWQIGCSSKSCAICRAVALHSDPLQLQLQYHRVSSSILLCHCGLDGRGLFSAREQLYIRFHAHHDYVVAHHHRHTFANLFCHRRLSRNIPAAAIPGSTSSC